MVPWPNQHLTITIDFYDFFHCALCSIKTIHYRLFQETHVSRVGSVCGIPRLAVCRSTSQAPRRRSCAMLHCHRERTWSPGAQIDTAGEHDEPKSFGISFANITTYHHSGASEPLFNILQLQKCYCSLNTRYEELRSSDAGIGANRCQQDVWMGRTI